VQKKVRYKFKKSVRERGLRSITRYVREFEIGERVHIKIDSASQKGRPHPRFHGRTGKIIDRRGRAYIVEVRDGGKFKKLIVNPEHLMPQKLISEAGE
jgi:large subunit ribosomal protein L21e